MESPSPVASSHGRRAVVIRLAVMALVFVIAAFVVWPNVPQSQSVRLHQGTGSTNVHDVVARVRRHNQRAWDREATWHFPHGAPAAVPWEFELQRGDAEFEIELSSSGRRARSETRDFHLDLQGGESSLELGALVRVLDEP